MKTRRLILAVGVALIVSGTLTVWLGKKLTGTNTTPADALQYIVTAQKVEAGEILKSQDIEQKNWPASAPLAGALTRASDVVGRVVLYPLAAGEPIQDGQLAPAGSGVGLGTRIPSGMRAMSLRSDEVVGVAGFLSPGTRVDVLVTYTTPDSASPLTSIVLQNVEVLAIGQKLEPDPKGKATPVGVVTLLVAPQDAEKAVLASTQGKVHFILRNDSDSEQLKVPPALMSELSQRPEPVVAPRKTVIVQKAVPAPAPPKYSVEVVAGDSVTRETFQ